MLNKIEWRGVEFMQCDVAPDNKLVAISPLSDNEFRVLEIKGEICDFDSLLRWMVRNKRIIVAGFTCDELPFRRQKCKQ